MTVIIQNVDNSNGQEYTCDHLQHGELTKKSGAHPNNSPHKIETENMKQGDKDYIAQLNLS